MVIIMKKMASLFTAAALSLALTLPVSAAMFNDTENHWAEKYITSAAESGLINGDGDGTFRPEDSITRAEFLKILSACMEKNIDMSNTAGIEHWVAPYYNYALSNYLKPDTEEIISSANGTSVHPGVLDNETADLPIERWEMAYLVWQGVDNYLITDDTIEFFFNDKEQIINTYPQSILNSLANVTYPDLALFQGDENNNFNADSYATRAEAATLMVRANALLTYAQSLVDTQPPAAWSHNPGETNNETQNQLDSPPSTPDNTTQPEDTTPNENNTSNQEKENQNMAEHSFATVTMENGGTFKIELMPEYAPETVANFIALAESGFYNGVTFHRIVDGFMAQGGDPEGTGMGGSDKTIKGEFASNGFTQNTLSHTRGVISMARSSNPDSASSQFFICYDDASFLDGDYAAFGKVVEGMEVVDGFLKVERTANSMGEKAVPTTPIVIKSITISK